MMAEVFTQRESQKLEAEITYAWMNAYYQRVETLNPLKECIDEALGRKPDEMSEDAMLAMVMKLNAQFGGSVEGEVKETEQEKGGE